jgi:hypothetical protein
MVDLFDVPHLGAITAICYLIGELVKRWTKIDRKRIPSIVMTAGGLLGIVALYAMPTFPTTDILAAIAIGIVSGAASTGVHQRIQKLTTNGGNKE